MILNDYYQATGNKLALSLFQDGISELRMHLQDYDTGHWTYYDREGNLAYDYHYIHVGELQSLYEITSDEVLKKYHDKWARYFPINPMWARKRFAAYLLNVAVIVVISLLSVSIWYFMRRRSKVRTNKEQTNLQD